MRIILSHPYAGALNWWLQSTHFLAHPKTTDQPYYRHLYGDVDRHIDVGLACVIIFDEVIVAAADSAYPESAIVSTGGTEIRVPELQIHADWEAVWEAGRAVEMLDRDILADSTIVNILKRVPPRLRLDVVRDVMADMSLMRKYQAPLISSRGRRALVLRLAEMGVFGQDANPLMSSRSTMATPRDSKAQDSESGALSISVAPLESYVRVTGLAFKSPDVQALSTVKDDPNIRTYASRFQGILTNPSDAAASSLYESIAHAWSQRKTADKVSHAFSTASHSLSILGFVPVVGTVASIAGLGADAGEIAAEQRAKSNSWFELGPEVLRLESLTSLARYLSVSAGMPSNSDPEGG